MAALYYIPGLHVPGLIYPSEQTCKLKIIHIIFVLQLRKLKVTEVKSVAEHQQAGE